MMTMEAELILGLALGAAAALLLGRDLYRAWRDPLRRPMTLLVAAIIVVVLIGTVGRAHPSPLWLLLPAAILGWEVERGWRRTPRCRLWEAGVAAFAINLALGAAGLLLSRSLVLGAAAACAAAGLALFWSSRRREPRPWRTDDVAHYERRSTPRNDSDPRVT